MRRLRRTLAQLELEIVELLEKIPLSTYSIAKHLKMTSRTAKRRLEFFEKMDRVEALRVFENEDDEENRKVKATYWKLKK